MNKNRLEYQQPVILASAQLGWPPLLPPTGWQVRARLSRRGPWAGAGGQGVRQEVRGQDRVSEASVGGMGTTLSSPGGVEGDGGVGGSEQVAPARRPRRKDRNVHTSWERSFRLERMGKFQEGGNWSPYQQRGRDCGFRARQTLHLSAPGSPALGDVIFVRKLNLCAPQFPHL